MAKLRLVSVAVLFAVFFTGVCEGKPVVRGPAILKAEPLLVQRNNEWFLDYFLQAKNAQPLTVGQKQISGSLVGWVSGYSNCLAHSRAKPANISFEQLGAEGSDGQYDGYAEVIASGTEGERCREPFRVDVWNLSQEGALNAQGKSPGVDVRVAPLVVSENHTLRIRIILGHEHLVYGTYDPFFLKQKLKIKIGPIALEDDLEIHREQYRSIPDSRFGEPPDEHRDRTNFISAPDSLLLDAEMQGQQYFRFPELKVRAGARVKLTFWYLKPTDGEGNFKVRIAQYRESPNAWTVLSDGGSDTVLPAASGRWARYEKILKLEPEATTFALDFRIVNADFGRVWIDDVRLSYLDYFAPTP